MIARILALVLKESLALLKDDVIVPTLRVGTQPADALRRLTGTQSPWAVAVTSSPIQPRRTF